ncbi:MAG TPA: long-chain-acyl-CoA synthetase [Bryobacteraceae bacterium]|nr:long-chain-acyl-CoA synthetase [Bryobacteraceae bacterium]
MTLTEPVTTATSRVPSRSPAKAWLRALELTAPIANHPSRIFPRVIEEIAEEFAGAPALLSDFECLNYGALAKRAHQYARWALEQGLAKGDTVCLMMPNRPEYMAVWLGITSIGAVVALLNTHLVGSSLTHCVNIVAPKHVIVDAELSPRFASALPDISKAAQIWVHGDGCHQFPRIDVDIEQYPGEKLHRDERRKVTVGDRALYIYTSGTTGVPKAANVSHARLMQWSHWFAGLLETNSNDRLYDCLPMYHGVGGVLATGAVLVVGGSATISKDFSARRFWNDIVRWDCTLFQYIGELCRYLLLTEPNPLETEHSIRACCGNGLRSDIWRPFESRFRIPRVLEFYAATEGNVSLFNVEGKPGAIGRVPSYLAHRFSPELVQSDIETGEPVRNQRGFCIRCASNEVGEVLGRHLRDLSSVGSRFEGYSSEEASEKKILRNVFEPGDAWYRTGDLMRKDEQGYYYFVDRIGDTFRWKGENVATSEVEEVICAFPGIQQACVYGVAVPGAEGRAGMAMLVTNDELDIGALRAHLIDRLPDYAVPLFLRTRYEMEVSATFKYQRNVLVRQGYDPIATSDLIYFNHKERREFVRLDHRLYEHIQLRKIRL